MKKARILALIAIIIVIPVIFCGCSLLKMLGLVGSVQLDAPTGLTLSDDASYITWGVTQYATGYHIYIDGTKVGESSTNIYYFDDKDGQAAVQLKAISASHKYSASALSESVTLNIKSRLVITGVSSLITETLFMVYWADANYKLKYTVKIYIDGDLSEQVDVYNPAVSLDEYDNTKEYNFKIKAVADASGRRVDSAEYSFTVEQGAAASTIATVLYDKIAAAGPEITNLDPSAVKVYLNISGVRTDVTSHSVITSDKVTLSASYLKTLAPNVYNGELDAGRKRFVLVIADTRDMTLEDITFVKNSDYANVNAETYNNSIISIDVSGTTGNAEYNYATKKIVIDGEYLDSLEENDYDLNVVYGQGSVVKEVSAIISVVSLPAIIPANARYNYYGQSALTIAFSQRGDTVTSLVLSDYGTVAVSNYEKAKNSITISKEFLLARGNGEYVYCIHTQKGSALIFTVVTDIRDFALQYSEYTYDKASGEDMVVGAIIVAPEDFEGMYGAMITEDDYTIEQEQGIIIQKQFLQTFKKGSYEFICISDGVEDYFTLNIINSSPKPYNVKLNYDKHATDVYLTFDCDCSGNHTYSLNGATAQTISGKERKLTGYDKAAANTITVTCVSSGRSTTVAKAAPGVGASSYIASRYAFWGESRDRFIESQDELNHLLRYMVYRGYDATKTSNQQPYSYVEETVYYSQEFVAAVSAQTALNAAVSSFSSPWGYGVSTSTAGNVVSITVNYSHYPGYDVTTAYEGSASADTRAFITASGRSSSFDSFYIETMTKTQNVRNTIELVDLPLGVKPVFTAGSAAEELYEAAKDVCRVIISDSMTEAEKVSAIYYWLATNVVYDYDSISLYNLYAQVTAASVLGNARTLIDNYIALNPGYSELLTPIRSKALLKDLKDEFNSTIKRMRVFAAEGAIIDGKAVCNGIAYAVLLMCKIEGIEAIKVSGTAFNGSGSENHAWNKVNIQDVWYVVDATWGRMGNYVTHNYLLVSDYSIFASHREENRLSGGSMRNVEYLARGHIDYYRSYTVGEYDLSIDSIAELNAVVAALYSQGIRTIELKYNIEDNFNSAISSALNGVHIGSYQIANAGNVYIVNMG